MSNESELRRAKLDLLEAQEVVATLPQEKQDLVNKLVGELTGIIQTHGAEGLLAFSVAGLAVQVAALKQGA